MIPVTFYKPAKILTADSRRQSADKKAFLPEQPSQHGNIGVVAEYAD
jgi:hypothetical protein